MAIVVSTRFDLVYASNIPVILMAALLANINMFTLLFWSHPTLEPNADLRSERLGVGLRI